MKTLYISLFTFLMVTKAFSQSDGTVNTKNTSSSPVTLADLNAFQQVNGVQITWSALSESDMSTHEIQKSVDGTSFSVLGTIPAQNNGNSPYKYLYSDATPVSGNNYYRIRSTDKKGDIVFSKILRVDNSYRKSELKVLSNPVRNGVLNVQLSNFSSGKYTISLYSNSGNQVFARTMEFSKGTSTEILNVPSNVSSGLYFLQVTNGLERINKQVMLQ